MFRTSLYPPLHLSLPSFLPYEQQPSTHLHLEHPEAKNKRVLSFYGLFLFGYLPNSTGSAVNFLGVFYCTLKGFFGFYSKRATLIEFAITIITLFYWKPSVDNNKCPSLSWSGLRHLSYSTVGLQLWTPPQRPIKHLNRLFLKQIFAFSSFSFSMNPISSDICPIF